MFLASANELEAVSIHSSHLQLSCNLQMHIKPHFLYKLISFAGV